MKFNRERKDQVYIRMTETLEGNNSVIKKDNMVYVHKWAISRRSVFSYINLQNQCNIKLPKSQFMVVDMLLLKFLW